MVRGEDLLGSTARQAFLHDLLGLTRPEWVHVPLVTDEGGQRLAKRSDAEALSALREDGVRAEALIGWCARTLGLSVPGPASAEEVLEAFTADIDVRRAAPFGPEVSRELRGPF